MCVAGRLLGLGSKAITRRAKEPAREKSHSQALFILCVCVCVVVEWLSHKKEGRVENEEPSAFYYYRTGALDKVQISVN